MWCPLSRLETLCLRSSELHDLPISVAAALCHLRNLDLSHNAFKQIPVPVGKIATLRALDMSINTELELTLDDLDILAALSCLTSLCFCKYSSEPDLHAGFAPASLSVITELTERFPKLHLLSELHISKSLTFW